MGGTTLGLIAEPDEAGDLADDLAAELRAAYGERRRTRLGALRESDESA